MSCTGSTILPWTRLNGLLNFWVHVSMLLAPFDFSQIRIAGREERGTKNCASTFMISSIRPVGASRRRCVLRRKCSGACAELSRKFADTQNDLLVGSDSVLGPCRLNARMTRKMRTWLADL